MIVTLFDFRSLEADSFFSIVQQLASQSSAVVAAVIVSSAALSS